jgi:molybdopterin-guanine dinucleotide biosynthesis protein A
MSQQSLVLVGLFVGGAARRMGGAPKGLIRPGPDSQTILARQVQLALELGAEPVLVGRATDYARAFPTLRALADEPAGIGPLGGLRALCLLAHEGPFLALACDMPYVDAELLRRLMRTQPSAAALAPRGDGGFWEPLCARYHAARVLPAIELALQAGELSLQRILSRVGAVELPLSEAERRGLIDWDAPRDLAPEAELPDGFKR